MSRSIAAAALASIALSLAGCNGEGGDSPDALSASCMEATQHSDYAWLQEKVFTPSCAAFSSCHQGTAPEAGGMSLEPGRMLAQTIDIDSRLFPQFKRIKPGDPANSYLWIVMGREPGPLAPDVGTMPYNNPPLCAEKRAAVERWIAAGALETEVPVDAGIDAPVDARVDGHPGP